MDTKFDTTAADAYKTLTARDIRVWVGLGKCCAIHAVVRGFQTVESCDEWCGTNGK
jgi:hypothetical protein